MRSRLPTFTTREVLRFAYPLRKLSIYLHKSILRLIFLFCMKGNREALLNTRVYMAAKECWVNQGVVSFFRALSNTS